MEEKIGESVKRLNVSEIKTNWFMGDVIWYG